MQFTNAIWALMAMTWVGCEAQTSVPTSSVRSGARERQCAVLRLSSETDACFAVRCAEDFIRRNGYTSQPVTGPLQTESFVSPSPEQRRGSLEGAAAGYVTYSSGHLVAFRHASSTRAVGRAVTMSATFGDLKVEHQDFILSEQVKVPHCDQDGGPG